MAVGYRSNLRAPAGHEWDGGATQGIKCWAHRQCLGLCPGVGSQAGHWQCPGEAQQVCLPSCRLWEHRLRPWRQWSCKAFGTSVRICEGTLQHKDTAPTAQEQGDTLAAAPGSWGDRITEWVILEGTTVGHPTPPCRHRHPLAPHADVANGPNEERENTHPHPLQAEVVMGTGWGLCSPHPFWPRL